MIEWEVGRAPAGEQNKTKAKVDIEAAEERGIVWAETGKSRQGPVWASLGELRDLGNRIT